MRVREREGEQMTSGDGKPHLKNICISPGVVPAVRLDEVHVSVLGQEGHQLVIGPEMEGKHSVWTGRHMVRPRCWWNIDFSLQQMLLTHCGDKSCFCLVAEKGKFP